MVFPGTPGFDLIGFGDDAGAIYEVAPEDGSLSLLAGEARADSFSPLAVLPKGLELPSGSKIRRQTVVSIVSTGNASVLRTVDLRSGRRTSLVRLERRVDAVGLVVVPRRGVIAIEADGTLLRIDLASGRLIDDGSFGRHIDVAGFDPLNRRILAVADAELLAMAPSSLTVRSLGVVEALRAADPCGVTRFGRGIVVADRASNSIIVVNTKTLAAAGTIGPSPLPATICGLVALR